MVTDRIYFQYWFTAEEEIEQWSDQGQEETETGGRVLVRLKVGHWWPNNRVEVADW